MTHSPELVTPQVKIETHVRYLDHESNPEQGQFVFTYRIRIVNTSKQSLQLISRQWMITDSIGRTEEVQGLGVVGQQPKIASGDVFEYESFCPLPTSSGSMKGFYHFVDESGVKVSVPISEFYLIAPYALH